MSLRAIPQSLVLRRPVGIRTSTVQWSLLPSLALSQLIVLGIMAISGDMVTPEDSFLFVTIASIAGIVAFYWLYGKKAFGRSCLTIVLLAFLLRLITGVVHYLLIIDPNYFANPSHYNYLWDFQWMHESMIQVSNEFHEWGFLTKMPNRYYLINKNAYITIYNAFYDTFDPIVYLSSSLGQA